MLVDKPAAPAHIPKKIGGFVAMRPKKKSEHLTRLEMEIMNVLWEAGPANVQTVQRRLGRDLAYTTVQTMLNVLVRKKKVTRTLKDRAYYYRPMVSREKVAGHAIKDLIDRLFGGSAESLVMSLVESRHITPEKLAKLNRIIKAKETRDGDD
jgi:predicted transcriptional regulator